MSLSSDKDERVEIDLKALGDDAIRHVFKNVTADFEPESLESAFEESLSVLIELKNKTVELNISGPILRIAELSDPDWHKKNYTPLRLHFVKEYEDEDKNIDVQEFEYRPPARFDIGKAGIDVGSDYVVTGH